MTICEIEGCDKKKMTRGMCTAHYKRMKRHGDPLAGDTMRGAPMAWLENVALKSQTDSCLEWPYGKAVGYGSIRINRKAVGTHRYVCLTVHGEPPEPRMEAAHECGNPACCNPRHLRWATPAENTEDRRGHGTLPVGEASRLSRFKDQDILDMRRLYREGHSFTAIAKKYQHDVGAMRRIIIGKTWAHLPLQQETRA